MGIVEPGATNFVKAAKYYNNIIIYRGFFGLYGPNV